MRAPTTLLRTGAAAVAALFLLTACGGSDDDQPDAAGASSSSSAASAPAAASGSTSDDDVQAFCTDAEAVFTQLSDSLDAAQPADLSATLDQAVTSLDQLEPPAEISADWGVARDAFAGLRDAVAGVDINTPEGQATVQQAATDLQAQAGDAQTNIDAWVSQNCDNA